MRWLLLPLLLACASAEPPKVTAADVVDGNLFKVEGKATVLKLLPEEDRMYFAIISTDDQRLLAVVHNDENFDVLVRLAEQLSLSPYPVTVYGKMLSDEGHQEIKLGLDLWVEAVELYDTTLSTQVVIDTRYGDRLRDGVDSSSFFKWLLKSMGGAAKKAVIP
jgi:hypothetical protein